MPRTACAVFASAGAIIDANRIGVSNGTTISRGVRALRSIRRRASVANARPRSVRAMLDLSRLRTGSGVVMVVMVVMASLSFGRSRGALVAGEVEVDVIERRGAHGDALGLACDLVDD